MPKERRRRYTNYSRPQSYLDPLRPGEGKAPRANISRTLLEEVRFAGEELQKSRDEINAFKSAQEKRKFDLQEKILKTKSIEKDNPMNTLTPQLNAMVNDVQKAYLDGFKSGDMSLAEDKERNVNRAVDTILGVTAALDTESKKIQDMSAEEAEKVILHSQFVGDDGMVTPEDRKKYLDLLKDPSKLGYRYENGDWVIQLKTDGGYVDLFNGTEYKNAYEKDGFALIKTADNYDEEIKTLDAEVSQGLDALKTKTIETKIASGKATTTELIDYSEAAGTYRDRLENNLSLEALINESNYQRFVPKNQRAELDKSSPTLLTRKKKYMEFSDDPNSASYKKTREELINYMVSQRYPSNEVVSKKIIKPEDQDDSSGKNIGKEDVVLDFSKTESVLNRFNKEKETRNKLLNDPGRVGTIDTINESFKKKQEQAARDIAKSLSKFKNKEISIGKGKSNQQIYDFKVEFSDDGFLVRPYSRIRNNQGEVIEAFATTDYLINSIDDLEALEIDLIQGGTKPSKSGGNIR